MYHPYAHNADKYVAYYTAQAGGDLPGYSGLGAQYGAGLGGIFRGLFRLAFPLLKKGFTFAAPHLKTAAKNIATDVITNVINRRQEGSGIVAVAPRPIKRPPGKRGSSPPKRRSRTTNKKTHTKTRKNIKARSSKSTKRQKTRDIF